MSGDQGGGEGCTFSVGGDAAQLLPQRVSSQLLRAAPTTTCPPVTASERAGRFTPRFLPKWTEEKGAAESLLGRASERKRETGPPEL